MTGIAERHVIRRPENGSSRRPNYESKLTQLFPSSDDVFRADEYMTLCNAGHPTPLLYRAKLDVEPAGTKESESEEIAKHSPGHRRRGWIISSSWNYMAEIGALLQRFVIEAA